jgi:hypothetical protein
MTKTKPTPPPDAITAAPPPPTVELAQRLANISGRGVVGIRERLADVDAGAIEAMLAAGENDSALAILFGDAKAS